MQWYASQPQGWMGIHCEGRLWLSLFALLLWDQIFTPMPHVFQTSFQTCPLDLGCESFYNSRVDAIEAVLYQLSCAATGEISEMLASSWVAHHPRLCRGVNWEFCELAQLQSIAECIGGKVLAHAFRLLAIDYSHWHAGLPDLVLWRPDGCAKLVEVKGPNDRLSDIQEGWLCELVLAGADVEVLQVREDV